VSNDKSSAPAVTAQSVIVEVSDITVGAVKNGASIRYVVYLLSLSRQHQDQLLWSFKMLGYVLLMGQ